MARNPNWTRDELILALDLYFRVNPLHTDENHPEIVKLSGTLNKLPIHPRSEKSENFRNPDGVYMKLCNYLRLDPSYKGVGLNAGAKLDEVVWNEFSSNHELLKKTTDAIINNYSSLTPPRVGAEDTSPTDEDEDFPEGRILSRIHRLRERNPVLVKKKKGKVIKDTGRLSCEVCDFDFEEFYGDIGRYFAECHHKLPVSELRKEVRVKLSDLSIVCANCHRILHRIRPWRSTDELRALLELRRLASKL